MSVTSGENPKKKQSDRLQAREASLKDLRS